MPTTPVDVKVITDTNGAVQVTIQISPSSGQSSLPKDTAQIEPGEYGLVGLNKPSWARAEPAAGGGTLETWFIHKAANNVDQYVTALPKWGTAYLGAYVPRESPVQFLRRHGANPSDYRIVQYVADYPPIGMMQAPHNGNSAALSVYEFQSGNRVHVGYLYREIGGTMWQDTWAFNKQFIRANPSVALELEKDNTPYPTPDDWKNARQADSVEYLQYEYPKL
jgi:hypothetical protein